MIDYTNWRVIGRGTERTCYQNPADPARCVKIARKGRFKQTIRETGYFRFLANRGVPFDHLPQFYGKIEEKGIIGIEQELILDRMADDGSGNGERMNSSKTIDQYLASRRTPEEIRIFWHALDELKAWLLKYNVLALGIDHNNVVVNLTEGGGARNTRMILIDGVYDTEWIPVSKYLPCFGRRKILRRWNRFIDQLHERYPQLNEPY